MTGLAISCRGFNARGVSKSECVSFIIQAQGSGGTGGCFHIPQLQGPLNTSTARHAHLGGVDEATGAGAWIRRPVGIGAASTAGHAHPGRIVEATTATARIGGLVGIAATTAWQTHPCRIGEATGAAAGIGRYVLG